VRGDGKNETGSFKCVDETGCSWEKITACAFNATTETGPKVKFLACMDGQGGDNPQTPAKFCATQASLDYDAINKCYQNDQGDKLLQEAARVFDAALIGSIPHIFVDGKFTQPDYDDMKTAICAANTTTTGGPCSGPAPGPAPSQSYKCEFFKGECVADPNGKYSSAADCSQKCG